MTYIKGKGYVKTGYNPWNKNKKFVKDNVICKVCEKSFYYFDKNKKFFCSSKCYWESLKGKKWFEPTEKLIKERKERMTGTKNPMWVNGKSDVDRRNSEYKKWRINVFKRDKFICQKCGYFNGCGKKRRDLHAHHIIKWIESIEFRYDINNGITLCVPCHIKEHSNKD